MSDDSAPIPIEGFPSSRRNAAPAGRLWHVPPQHNPYFTGREQILSEIHGLLTSERSNSRVQVLVGLAGIGKSQIALEYALRHRDQYVLVWWLRADNEASLINDIGLMHAALLPDDPKRHPQAAREAVRRDLEISKGWLLVFDGAADPAVVSGYLPQQHSGHVIVTSRNPNWRGTGSKFPVPPMPRNESIFFLRRRSGRTDTLLAAGHLAKALGDLPLALDQAATLIEQAGISFAEYLRRFEAHWAELLGLGRSGDRHDSLAMSLELSFRELEAAAPAPTELMNLLSFFAPEGFSKRWILAGSGTLPDPLASSLSEPSALEATVGCLLRFAVVESRDGQLFMHRLVSALARGRLAREQQTEWVHRALRLMESLFRFDAEDPHTWAESAAMLPHAMASIEYAQQTDVTVAAACSLLTQIGQCLLRMGRYEEARGAFDRALQVGYRLYGEANPRLSALANNLGRVLLKLADFSGARQQFEWAVSLDERAYGPDHPHVAEVLNNYGLCLAKLGEDELAGKQFERALSIYATRLGSTHANVASITNNLGYLRMKTGNLTGAWELLQRSLGMTQASFGPNHPDVANILLNLGDVLRLQGTHAAARAQYLRALAIDEIAYGGSHPDVARDLAHLGQVLMDLQELSGAREHFERALAIDEAAYGPNNSLIADRLVDLGRCLKALDEVDGSVECFTRAAEIFRAREKAASDSSAAAA